MYYCKSMKLWHKRFERQHLRRVGLAGLGLIALALLAYTQIIRPNQLAAAYHDRLDVASSRLYDCFERLDQTRRLPVFEAPDVALSTKLQNAAGIVDTIDGCDDDLTGFKAAAQTLPPVRFSGYTHEFRNARNDSQAALNVAGQTTDVLRQYRTMAEFLEQYYRSLEQFERSVSQLNELQDVAVLANHTVWLSEQAAELRRQAQHLRSVQAYPGFERVTGPTAGILESAATGFELLYRGYSSRNDASIDAGFTDIESARASYDSRLQTLPFQRLQQSYIVSQVGALPAKLDGLSR